LNLGFALCIKIHNNIFELEIEGKLEESPEENANHFNKYYANVVNEQKRTQPSGIDKMQTKMVTEKTIFLTTVTSN
jgi:hypothetical protein